MKNSLTVVLLLLLLFFVGLAPKRKGGKDDNPNASKQQKLSAFFRPVCPSDQQPQCSIDEIQDRENNIDIPSSELLDEQPTDQQNEIEETLEQFMLEQTLPDILNHNDNNQNNAGDLIVKPKTNYK